MSSKIPRYGSQNVQPCTYEIEEWHTLTQLLLTSKTKSIINVMPVWLIGRNGGNSRHFKEHCPIYIELRQSLLKNIQAILLIDTLPANSNTLNIPSQKRSLNDGAGRDATSCVQSYIITALAARGAAAAGWLVEGKEAGHVGVFPLR